MKFRMQEDLLPIRTNNKIDSMISHVFLNCVNTKSNLVERWHSFKDENPDCDMEVDMTLLIDGEEVDVKKFFDHLWNQYSRQVETEAKKLFVEKVSTTFTEKINDLAQTLIDCEEVIKSWSQEINWGVTNPFLEDPNVDK